MDSGLCPRSTARLLLLVAVLPVFQAQTVTVDDSLSGFIGTSVVLRCTFVNNDPKIKITQVTWQKATNGSKQNIAIFHPSMGVSVLPPYQDRVSFKKPSLNDATIELSRLELMDEGVYICEFATFPTGNRESQVNLTVFARPVIDAELTPHTIIARADHPRKIVVATCTCANGKPPGVITWETKVNGETIVKESRNQNGTITVTSQYLLVPSREAHRQPLTCVVNYQMDRTTKVLMLNVQYEPEVTVEGFDGNWYLNRENVRLTCKADGNPPATKYNWKMLNGSLPVNVEPQNTTLLFKGTVTYELAGTYVCEATNAIGTRSGLVEVNITESPQILPSDTPSVKESLDGSKSGGNTLMIGAIVGGAVLVLLAGVIVFIILRKRQQTFKGDYNTKKHVFGNGYGKAGIMPPGPQQVPYQEESDEDKKLSSMNVSYENERKVIRDGADFDADSKRPYFTVDESDTQEEFDEQTLSFQYPPDLTEDMVSQNDGSIISKKEWYV
ncbi:nectin cell adhesion molecule 1b isoform X2 [Pristis pectinata]|uniref:nectin cell adhesion molecule 1b isoform X2 n=1 Tax=Pristis pectinata TaxID=685728 RepID=UPI00223E208E|nr:nectin cell adhesion molecule 1b isoform X2 [Pristis pectinata]